ncbi:MAG: SUMF1/EgtB/PvdO family nonheme iron enzyme, partial [Bacteroidota bacterium]|nr:SUMF1/EgtB/PvdO family nonheme iron enzyme [Bacteroidota bacterium]
MKKSIYIIGVFVIALITSCSEYETSSITGWDYNNPKNGGFQKVPYAEQETGPGLILVEGGTFTMGRIEQDVTFENHNVPRRVTVSSFYMDETEISNFHWCEYLYWVGRTYIDFPMIYKKALPDTLCWREKLGFNEKYVEYYLRHPAYRDYPVVGVSWNQANDFAAWRTDRVNEYILIREGILLMNPNQQNEPFTTDAYFAGQYEQGLNPQGQIADLDPSKGGYDPTTGKFKPRDMATRTVKMSDGILLPRYRLPTEAEWEFAAYGLIGNTIDERIIEKRLYPWDGHWVRNPQENFQGDMLANFVRGRGDYMGVAGHLNDNADITAPIYSYWPNDYGLYNMAGNVSEWVSDVYRPLSSEDVDEFRPYRGNVFKTKTLNASGSIDEKYDATIYDIYGIEQYLVEFRAERQGKAERKYGYSPKNMLDSVETELLNTVDQYVQDAKKLLEDKQIIEASVKIQEIFDNVFEDFEMQVEQDVSLAGYSIQISPMLRVGMANYIVNTPGNVKMRNVTAEENMKRSNYRIADNIDYLDGDLKSSKWHPGDPEFNEPIINEFNSGTKNEDFAMYQRGPEKSLGSIAGAPTTLISDKSRVFKGASWKDRAYYLNPGTRRFLEEDRSLSTIGFRCAMDRIGSP